MQKFLLSLTIIAAATAATAQAAPAEARTAVVPFLQTVQYHGGNHQDWRRHERWRRHHEYRRWQRHHGY